MSSSPLALIPSSFYVLQSLYSTHALVFRLNNDCDTQKLIARPELLGLGLRVSKGASIQLTKHSAMLHYVFTTDSIHIGITSKF